MAFITPKDGKWNFILGVRLVISVSTIQHFSKIVDIKLKKNNSLHVIQI